MAITGPTSNVLAICTQLLLLTGGGARAAESTAGIFEIIKADGMSRIQALVASDRPVLAAVPTGG
jgi:hypothetical protein